MVRLYLSLFLISISTALIAQVQRKALIEEFTNASCAPCASQNPDFNVLIDNNEGSVVPIKYQTAFPGFDPMNQDNPGEVADRFAYYVPPGQQGVPTATIDGVLPGDSYADGAGEWNVADGGYEGGPYGYNQAVINYANSIMAPVSIALTHSINNALDSIFISAIVRNEIQDSIEEANLRLRVALVEKELLWPFSPGSTNEKDFFYVMKKMYPDANGTTIPVLDTAGEFQVDFALALPDYVYNYRELSVVAFVQNDLDKAVWQAEFSAPQDVPEGYNDIKITSASVFSDDLCDFNLTPQVTLTNNGDVVVDTIGVELNLNDVIYAEVWTGMLEPGAEETFTFEDVELSAGSSAISYSAVAGSLDLNVLDNLTEPEGVQRIGDVETEIFYTWEEENVPAYPSTGIVDIPAGFTYGFVVMSRQSFIDVFGFGPADLPDQIGAYGESTNSVFINFYQWQIPELANTGEMILLNRADLSNYMDPYFTLDRAHVGYSGFPTADNLQVLVSNDCGMTWEVVYDKAGNDLATGSPEEPFYLPTADEWASDTVSLAEYAGEEEVTIKLRAVSDWGNNLYLDNFRLGDFTTGISQIIPLEGSVDIFPNPANEQSRVDVKLEKSGIYTIELFTMTGQKMQTLLSADALNAGEYQFSIDGADLAGMYLLRITDSENAVLTRKVQFVK